MKRLLIVLAALIVAGCCSGGSEPLPPYANPDEISRYSGTDGYASVTYIWYCRNGEYLSITYTRIDKCSDYVRDAVYRSGGICW